ncbi:MAG: hypothetical protein ACQERD_00135 [Campylobacterota bacterium]
MFSSISFEYPFVLLLIPFFIFCNIFCKAKNASYLIPHLHIYNKASEKSNFTAIILKYLIAIFSIIALASPVVIDKSINIKDYTILTENSNQEKVIEVEDNKNKLKKSRISQNSIIKKSYLFFYPLFLATISLILYIFIKNKE